VVGILTSATITEKRLSKNSPQVPPRAVGVHLPDRDGVYNTLRGRRCFAASRASGNTLRAICKEILSGIDVAQQVVSNALAATEYGRTSNDSRSRRFCAETIAGWFWYGDYALCPWGHCIRFIIAGRRPYYGRLPKNYVQISTQGLGREAEEIEQQVTIPLEDPDGPAFRDTGPTLRFGTSLGWALSLTLIFGPTSPSTT